jgi:hemolysin activation/secretion protein
MSSSPFRAAALALFAASGALAQDAQVLGPRSPLETYDAPVAKPAPAPVIDFPKLIAEPGADDAVQIAPSLTGLQLEFVGTEAATQASESGFVDFIGRSKVPAGKVPALHAALAATLAKYRDLPLTLGDARFIQQDITEAYAAQGFPLLSVVVPPQEIVGGRLRVQINEFNLASYRVQYGDGQGGYSETAPRRTRERVLSARLDPLLAEPVLSKASLDREVKRLNAGPYRQARVIFEPGQRLGETVALIQIDEKRPWSVQAGYNNHATKASGTDRYSLGGAMGYLPFDSHQLSWNATVGNRIDEFENYSLIYTAPLPWGHTFTVNANYSDTASSTIPGIDAGSTTLQLSAAYQIPLVARDAFTWDLGFTSFLKKFERESLFGGVVVGSADFDSVQLVVDNRFGWKEAAATNQFTVATTFSFEGVTSRNTDADFQGFYNSAAGEAATTHLVLNYARAQQLAPLLGQGLDGWSTETQLSWQLTGDELAGSDNFAIGGAQVLRAYQSSEVAGDEGLYFIQFLHAKPLDSAALGVAGKWIQQLSPSAFVEIGEGRFQDGRDETIWDYGVQVAVAARPGLSVTASLAFAGKTSNNTDRGSATCFVSAQWRY